MIVLDATTSTIRSFDEIDFVTYNILGRCITSEKKEFAEHLVLLEQQTEKADFVVAFKKKLEEALEAEGQEVSESETVIQTSSELVPNTPLVADEIIKLKGLLDAGVLTQEEFDKKKTQLLNL